MGKEIQLFENEVLGSVRCMKDENGEVLIVASDVAKGLGYRDAYTMSRMLDDEEKGTQNVCTLGGNQEMTVITESGFYHAAIKSRVEKAKEFRRWVTGTVLPQIRKTGGYIPVNAEDDEKAILCKAVTILQRTLQEKDNLLAAQQPKVDFANAVVGSMGSILIRDLAKVITQNGVKMGQTRLFYWLRKHGYLFQRETRPIQKWVEKGIFEISESVFDGVINVTTKVTGKGQEYFVNGFQSGKFNAGEGAFADISFK